MASGFCVRIRARDPGQEGAEGAPGGESTGRCGLPLLSALVVAGTAAKERSAKAAYGADQDTADKSSDDAVVH